MKKLLSLLLTATICCSVLGGTSVFAAQSSTNENTAVSTEEKSSVDENIDVEQEDEKSEDENVEPKETTDEEIPLVDDVDQFVFIDSIEGYKITSRAIGVGGSVVLCIEIDKDGNICDITVEEANETPSIGMKALESDYLSQFIGNEEYSELDSFSGATLTSNAIKECVEKALLQYEVIINPEVALSLLSEEEKTEEIVAEYLGESFDKNEDIELVDCIKTVYTSDKGTAMIAEADGVGGSITLMIYMNEKGTVKKIIPISHTEPAGRGDQFLTEASLYFYENYSGYAYFDDGSGAKVLDSFDDTSLAIGKMLLAAVEQFKLLNA